MELADERVQEGVERKNRLNMKKCKPPPTVSEVQNKIDNEKEKLKNLTVFEKEKLSEEYRLRGNEYFRAKEFDDALVEYTRSIQMYPEKSVAAYNNRALTYYKLKKYYESMKDCEESLKIEPNNIKARLRLAEAHYAYGRRKESNHLQSYHLYLKVLELDGENPIALQAIAALRQQYQDLPPPKATRLKIKDESSKANVKIAEKTETKAAKTEEKAETKTTNEKKVTKEIDKIKPKKANYDLADLIKPNRVIKNKLVTAAENLSKMYAVGDSKEKAKPAIPEQNKEAPKFILPCRLRKHSNDTNNRSSFDQDEGCLA
uniref:TPR_REGION domain-containing protein n=1 Tax=Glossina brevipalpis TaxID=37001 RepID=A0A1A9X3Y2_9MUSC